MTVHATSPHFKDNAKAALADEQLQIALSKVRTGFIDKRAQAAARLPEFEDLRDSARDIKDHTLAHLDLYLEAYEAKVRAAGGHVHFARDAAEARAIILDICTAAGARTVTKGKSMIAEEIGLNAHLEANGVTPVETDLGEYIIQLRGEMPSHIIAPAIHVNATQVEADFRRLHKGLDPNRDLSEPVNLLSEARTMLRERFLAADVGITGANFLIAETGTSVIVTNEGNGDLTQILPKTHVVILDNGRSAMLGTSFQEMLRCIRCGACMNHCPIYHAVGGHAYGWVYPGPMGAVLTPSLIGVDKAGHLPNASTFCGRCESVCPVRIPLSKIMRHWREREFERHLTPATVRSGLKVWGFFAKRPALYRFATRMAMGTLGLFGRRQGRFTWLPMSKGWTKYRDFPAPQGETFQQRWKRERRGASA